MATRFDPSGPLRGALRPPPDKSVSHRAALIAAMGEGETRIEGYLDAADTRSTLDAVRALGATVEGAGSDAIEPTLRVRGVGLRDAAAATVDVGNAGTLLRLLPGWLAGQEAGEWTLDGVASAQVKSCLLFAGLLAEGETRIAEPLLSRDHSERMLVAAGAEVERVDGVVSVRPATRLEPGEIAVPADFSSAAFLIVAALLVPGSDVSLAGVGLNPTRTGLLSILSRMGAEIEVEPEGERGGEPSGRLRIRPSQLRGAEVGGSDIPLTIDELPLVALAACFAEGVTTISDADELRRKESDRIATVGAALTALGGSVETSDDGMRIEGAGALRGGRIDSHGDHRIAMLGAVAGLASREGAEVAGMDVAAVSYPGFEADLASLANR